MQDFFRRYRELIVIGALLLATVVVWIAYRKDGRDLNVVDRAVLTVTFPISRAVSIGAEYTIDAVQGFTSLRRVRERNEELLRRVYRLEGQLADYGEMEAENRRLREMVGLRERGENVLLPVRIVGEGIGHNALTVTIDRGSADGVQPNMAVITEHGVVGRTASVATYSASVALLSDIQASIPVRVQRTRTRATVRGRGSGENFAVERLDRTGDVADGDLLVTSGTDGVFPKGIAVGRVTDLNRPDHGMFLSARAIPSVNLTCPDAVLEEVYVVLSFPGQGAFETAEKGADPSAASDSGAVSASGSTQASSTGGRP